MTGSIIGRSDATGILVKESRIFHVSLGVVDVFLVERRPQPKESGASENVTEREQRVRALRTRLLEGVSLEPWSQARPKGGIETSGVTAGSPLPFSAR